MRQTFTSRIKASNLAEMFVLAYWIGNKFVQHEISPLAHFGAMKTEGIYQTFSTSHLVVRIGQKYGILTQSLPSSRSLFIFSGLDLK